MEQKTRHRQAIRRTEHDKLHSVKSAAEFVGGISPWTIRTWFSRGVLRRTKVGGRVMVRESELQKVIQDQ